MDQAFYTFVERVGLPGAVLLAAAWWFAPRVDKLFQATGDNATTLKVMDAKVETHQGEIRQHLVELKGKVDQMLALLAANEDAR